jgi:adenosylmethionine-8-amino-7-oxononanoate aminotransferase
VAGVELVEDRATKRSFDVALGAARRVWIEALEHGVIVRPLSGDVLAISPPFVITEQEIDRIVDALDGAIAKVGSELRRQA